MQFPESWLREFCNPPLTSEALADTLTMGGFEVEERTPAAPPFTKVVVAEIKEAVPHPEADRLRVCQVDVGQSTLLSIVCGAPNARAGIKVPCALVGAELPPGEDGKPFRIKLGKLRGVESQGMLCSARELGLSDDHGGLLELAVDAPAGTDVREWLHLDDTLVTIKLTPNLAHGLSVYGIARELSALTGAPLNTPTITAVQPALDDKLPVTVAAPDLCGRFSGRIMRGVNTRAKSPAWLVDRLMRCGQRSVTALVDISNYVMFEYGQPTHIFDLDKIQGGLQVRWGQADETLKLLNGNTITVDDSVGVIADEREVESLAGIMGGDATAVSDDTQNIYIEAAFWWPEAVQGRSRRFNFSTDAGHRFERGVDPSRTAAVIERITALVQQICGGEAGPIDDQTLALPARKSVTLRVDRAARVIGMPLTHAQCADVMQRLGFAFTEEHSDLGDTLIVTPPPHRFDITIEEDLIEEVARLVGYSHLPDKAPQGPISARARPESQRGRFALRRRVADLGYQETINFSFVEAHWERDLAGNSDPIRLLNPIAAPMSVMRSSLIGSLLQVLKFNMDRKASRVRVFEVGRVFMRDDSTAATDTSVQGVRQPLYLAGLAWGDAEAARWDGKARRTDFFDVKGDVEALLAPAVPTFEPINHPALHPGRSVRVSLDGQGIGVVGELHPRWRQQWDLAQAPVLFELDFDAVNARIVPTARPVAKHQAVERDIAVVVNESVAAAAVLAAAHAAPTQGLLRDACVFDIFRQQPGALSTGGLSAGEKSLAVRLSLQSDAGSLTDVQVEIAVQAVLVHLKDAVGARLRG